MIRTSPPFKRGVLTGIFIVGAVAGASYVMAPSLPILTPGLRLLAAVNLLLCLAGAILLYRRETRSTGPGAA